MTTHEGLGARAFRTRSVNRKRLLALCKNKRFIRILIIQIDLGAKL